MTHSSSISVHPQQVAYVHPGLSCLRACQRCRDECAQAHFGIRPSWQRSRFSKPASCLIWV